MYKITKTDLYAKKIKLLWYNSTNTQLKFTNKQKLCLKCYKYAADNNWTTFEYWHFIISKETNVTVHCNLIDIKIMYCK